MNVDNFSRVRVPALINVEAVARGLHLTGEQVRHDGILFWLDEDGNAIGWNRAAGRYEARKFN